MRTRWLAALDAAGLGFLVLLVAGSAIVLAAKLQFADLGTGASPTSVLSVIAIIGLACLGASIHLGELTVSAVPLGFLALIGAALMLGTARSVRRANITEAGDAAVLGLQVGVTFGLICAFVAAIFRIRTEPTAISADIFSAGFFGTLWGCLAGVLGGLQALGSKRWLALRRARIPRGAVAAAGMMIVIVAVLGATATLLWIIVELLRNGTSVPSGFAEAAAALIYLIAFFPNIVVAIVSLGGGASVEIGARLTGGGRIVGELDSFSLFDWSGSSAPPWVYLLTFIPLVAAVLAGAYARLVAPEERPLAQFGIASGLVGLIAYEAATLASARLGAGLVLENGVAEVSIGPWAFLVAAVWAFAGGWLGLWVLERVPRQRYPRIVLR